MTTDATCRQTQRLRRDGDAPHPAGDDETREGLRINDSATASTARADVDGGFERDVLPLAGDLYRYALSRTKNAADAEDLVQDTMLKAFRAYGAVREDTYFKAWTLTIMKHTWISNHRATERRPAEHLVGDVSDEQVPSWSPDASEDMLSAEHHALRDLLDSEMTDALSALPEDMRRTVYYIAIEGMKYREAADLMGVSEGTVMSRMHRIRTKLRLALGDVAQQRGLLRDADGRHAA
jgi:RNA polymerase sigma-70 factor (ECF subfamily)